MAVQSSFLWVNEFINHSFLVSPSWHDPYFAYIYNTAMNIFAYYHCIHCCYFVKTAFRKGLGKALDIHGPITGSVSCQAWVRLPQAWFSLFSAAHRIHSLDGGYLCISNLAYLCEGQTNSTPVRTAHQLTRVSWAIAQSF